MFAVSLAVYASDVTAQSSSITVNTRDEQAIVKNSTKPGVIKPETNKPRSEALNLTRVGVQTAQPLPLSLADVIRKALEANNTIEVSRGDVRFQATVVEADKGLYDPVFTATPNFSQTSTTGSTATHDFRVNSNLTQFIKPGGGNYSVFFNNSRTESAFSQAQISAGSISSGGTAVYSSALGTTYTQPLFRNFGFDSRRQLLKVAKRRLEQTDVDFRTQVSDTINQVQRAYWDLVFALRNQQNQVANVNLARENLRQIEARIEAGAAAPLERAEVATELANREADLILATQQVSINENALKQFILRDAVTVEWSQSYVPTDEPTVGLTPMNLDDALHDAMDNRYELKRLQIEKEINDINIRFYKNQTKPQIDLNTTFSLQGFSRGGVNTNDVLVPLISGDPTLNTSAFLLQQIQILSPTTITVPNVTIPGTPTFLSGGFNRSLSNIFRSDAPNFSIGATISFPFGNRTAKANLAGARIQQEQNEARIRSEEQVVVVEVRNAVQAVETARQRVVAARTARENAEIQLAGERKLYESGKSTTFLLFQRENELTNARNAEIRAETDYRKSVADLQRATATTFRENNIDVVSPVKIK
ncbi:MAG TPA: TolC family protein [Pyrinomonadaceae bacterium]|nr:TolC family protein [Pyrinomonadaceae bacterium]